MTAIKEVQTDVLNVHVAKAQSLKFSDTLLFEFEKFKLEEGYRGDLIYPTHRVPFEQITVEMYADWYFGASNAYFEEGYEILNEDLVFEEVEFEFV